MAVDAKHSQYSAYSGDWKVIRDVVAGQRAVHKAKTEYLPALSGQTDDEYAAYVKRASFYNATARTLDGLTGMIFRRPAVVEMPQAMVEDFGLDCTLDGQPLNAFAEGVVEDVVALSRCGILVDFAGQVGEGQVSVAQARERGNRPFWRMYQAEAIFDWATRQVNGATVLSSVSLDEVIEEAGESIAQIRKLMLDGAGEYLVELWRKRKSQSGADEWFLFQTSFPLMRGARMKFIPFVFLGPRDQRAAVSKPGLLDLSNANIKHYQLSADYFHGLHFTGLPTAVVTGYRKDDSTPELRIGSAVAWLLPDPQSDAKYLEFTGQGLGELAKGLDRVESQMAFLGARMLAPEKASAEAAATVGMRRQGESSALASVAIAVSAGLTRALEIVRDWWGLTGDVKFALNHDFDLNTLSAQDMVALVDAWQKGAISKSVLRWNLREGELIPTEVTDEEMDEELEQEPPLGMQGLTTFDPSKPTNDADQQ